MQRADTKWRSGVTLIVLGWLAACGGGGVAGEATSAAAPETAVNEAADTETALARPGVISGTVLDTATRTGIPGAWAKVYIGTEVVETVAATDDAATTDRNEAGTFTLTDIPAGQHRIQLGADGYATYEGLVSVQPSDVPYYVAVGTNGTVALQKTCDVTVVVTSEGAVLSGATVYATGPGWEEVAARTNDEGTAVLQGLAEDSDYTLVVPAFAETPEIPGVQTMTRAWHCTEDEATVTLDLPSAEPVGSLYLVGGTHERYLSWTSDGYNYPVAHAMAPNEPLVLVYNRPVTVDQASVTLSHGFLGSGPNAKVEYVPASVRVGLSAANTVVTITPEQALPPNSIVALDGVVSFLNRGYTTTETLPSTWYVFDPAPLTTAGISIDNYNGQTGATTVANVSLEFTEFIEGTALIYAYTQDGVETRLPVPQEIRLGGASSWEMTITSDKAGGCTNGICGGDARHYRKALYPHLNLSMADDRPDARNTVEVFIDATDYDGHHIAARLVLPVE